MNGNESLLCVTHKIGDPIIYPPGNNEVDELGRALLRIGALLIHSGANTERVRITLNRISNAFDYDIEVDITYASLFLTLVNKEGEHFFSLRQVPHHVINFKILSGISRMSWRVVEEKWSVRQMNQEVDRLASLNPYPTVIFFPVVGMAGAAFCRLAGGQLLDLLVVFSATIIGLFVRQLALRKEFNYYLCIYFGAVAASLVAGVAVKLGIGYTHEQAFATSVLFLIPGVLLINTFSDLIDGHVQNGISRGVSGFVVSFAIALGLLTSMFICKL